MVEKVAAQHLYNKNLSALTKIIEINLSHTPSSLKKENCHVDHDQRSLPTKNYFIKHKNVFIYSK